jgi:hypothetical protein
MVQIWISNHTPRAMERKLLKFEMDFSIMDMNYYREYWKEMNKAI